MLWSLKQVVTKLEVSETEVTEWIAQSWVLPVEEEGELLFDEVDRARLALIVELRRDLEVNDEAVPVVLRLIDQVHGLRHTLDELRACIGRLSDPARAELDGLLHAVRDEESSG